MIDVFNAYQTMPEFHKNNLENYLICHGIYTTFPDICEEDAKIIYDFCVKNKDENTNVYRFSSYLTNEFTNGSISEEELKKLDGKDVNELPFYDNLNYFTPISNDKNIDEYEKDY